MITFSPNPIPVVTPLGDAYLIYVESGGQYENDIWMCCLVDGGDIRHFNTGQLKIYENLTFDIKKKQ
jgi:hypothetical protein